MGRPRLPALTTPPKPRDTLPVPTMQRIGDNIDAFLAETRRGSSLPRALESAYQGAVSEEDMYRYLRLVPQARAELDEARADAAHAYADFVADLAIGKHDDLAPDRARVRLAAAQWMASRRAPAVYGEKMQVQVTHIDMRDVLKQAEERAALARRREPITIEGRS